MTEQASAPNRRSRLKARKKRPLRSSGPFPAHGPDARLPGLEPVARAEQEARIQFLGEPELVLVAGVGPHRLAEEVDRLRSETEIFSLTS